MDDSTGDLLLFAFGIAMALSWALASTTIVIKRSKSRDNRALTLIWVRFAMLCAWFVFLFFQLTRAGDGTFVGNLSATLMYGTSLYLMQRSLYEWFLVPDSTSVALLSSGPPMFNI